MALLIGSTTVVDNSSNWQGTALGTSAIADSAITYAKMGFSANYAVANSVSITVNTTTPTVVASVSITTNGRPVMLMGCSDMNTPTGGGWQWMGLYRGEPLLVRHKSEWGGSGVNRPQNICFRDHPSAGTYTYSMRAFQGAGAMNYGEGGDVSAPAFVAIETI